MKKSLALLSSFILAVSLFTDVFAQEAKNSQTTSKNSKEITAPAKPNKPVTIETIEADVAEALTLIESNHVNGKKLNYNDVFKTAADSMLHSLDPHSNYFDAKEFEQFRTDQNSRYYGIGATIGDLRDAKGDVVATFIKATFENAPANRAGLRYGDKIIEVNGTSMLGKPFSEVREFLRGPRGTAAKLVVERYGTGKREAVEIIRDAVSQPSIAEAYMVRPGIGYIGMTGGFNYTTYNEFREAMQQLKAQGMQQLVLDLRNNGGGLVNQAYQVANTFLKSGQTVFTQKGRVEGAARSFAADNPSPDNTPIVVLVNRSTASASEILAGALQDHDRALIVGETTFGKGLVQNPFVFPEYGSMLLLTIAKYETPSGRLIQRDYSNGSLYDYYSNGGSFEDENKPVQPKGEEKRTASGRVVYSGGGINPDVAIKARTITSERARFQRKLNDPLFAFALDVAYGKAKGFETLKIDRPITFEYDIKTGDFRVDETIFQAFKKYAVEKYNFTPAQIDREREFVERTLRTELVTAAYGTTTSYQVFNDYDDQLLRAIELLPEAKQLAIRGAKASAEKLGQTNR
ncbi:MAG TPA: S41 family peptidase [Pyrinomonadaceae bacterium]|nr:S41 family peptidase [Pyrinomonadaceae bacterium]